MTAGTGPTGQAEGWSPRAVAAGGAVMFAAFAGLAVWGLSAPDPPEDAAPPALAPRPARVPRAAPAPAPAKAPEEASTPPPPAPAPSDDLKGPLKAPRELQRLLSQKFQFTRDDGTAAFAHLRSALGSERAVTVLNVWAPYCEPCKREFPAFRGLQATWGDDVRFLPIQLGDGDPGPLAALMPAAPHRLIDYVPGGAVQKTLTALGLLSDKSSIPITLVLDCKHQLRWLRASEITDIPAFARAVDVLRGELDTSFCTRPPPAPQSSTSPDCGNGICEPLEWNEDCGTCPADCRCKKNQLCALQTDPGNGHVCMDELQ